VRESQVLAKKAGLKRALQLFAPPVDVYLTVEVDRLIGAAMVLQVGKRKFRRIRCG
jgi:hypothetical protein